MKPIKLTMNAFGPYPARQEIDFATLGSAGLYLIYGETGSGKTTIFDAISFALFGRASGDSRQSAMLRSDFAKPEEKTFVELVFEVHGQQYRVTRIPPYIRPSLRGGGETRQTEEVSFLRPGKPPIDKRAEANKAIIDLLGIDQSQFSQIVMIAQNDFMRFLHAKTEERADILRNIFGTGFYQRLQDRLKARAAELRREHGELCRTLIHHGLELRCKQDAFIPPWQENPQIETLASLLPALKDWLARAADAIARFDAQRQEGQRALEERIQQKTAAKYTNDALLALADVVKKQEAHTGRLPLHNEHRTRHARGLAALEQVQPLHLALQQKKGELAQQRALIQEAQAALQSAQSALLAANASLETQTALEGTRQALLTRLHKLEALLPQYGHLAQLQKEGAQLQAQLETATNDKLAADKETARLETTLAQLQSKLEAIAQAQLSLAQANAALQKNRQRMAALTQLRTLQKSHQQKLELLSSLQADFQQMSLAYTQQSQLFSTVEGQFLAEQAGILAGTLAEGSPCPVCGSVHHPQPATISKDAPSQQLVQDHKQELERLRKETERLSASCAAAKADAASDERQLAQLLAEHFDQAAPSDDAILQERHSLAAEDERLQASITALEGTLRSAGDEQAALAAAEAALATAKQKAATLEDGLQALRSRQAQNAGSAQTLGAGLPFPSQQEAQSALTQTKDEYEAALAAFNTALLAQQQATLRHEQAQATLAERSTNEAPLHDACLLAGQRYESALAAQGFADEGDYLAALLSREALQDLQAEIDQYQLEQLQLGNERQRLESETKGKVYIDLDALDAQIEQLRQQSAQLETQIHNTRQSHAANLERLGLIEEGLRQKDALEARYSRAKLLSETANGELSAKEKISFETYAQTAYFARILGAANRRFTQMSAGQYELHRRQDAGDLRSKAGLALSVMDHHTGKLRDVRSLSGGESFMAALSLALGLSDVVQQSSGGVQLNAMFIDEGFGSLDEGALEAAISTLQSIAGGQRSVGIISHVQELRERIDSQLVVRKTKAGSFAKLV